MKIPADLGSRVTRFLASWVNLDVKDAALIRQDTALFGSLFAMPAIALASTALQSPFTGKLEQWVPTLAMATSLPILAAASLSLSGNKTVRSVISALVLPSIFLAATKASTLIPEVSLLTGLLAGLLRRENLIENRELTIGASLTAALACTGGGAIGAISALLGLAAFALAGRIKPMPEAKISSDSHVANPDVFAFLASVTGYCVEVDRRGHVLKAHGGFGALAGKRLADVTHIADQVSLLTALDGMDAGLVNEAKFVARIALPTKADATPNYQMMSLQLAKFGDRIFAIGQCAETNQIEQSSEIAPVASVCHELRTPLNAIIGFSDMLESGLAGELANGRQEEYVTLINRSGRHLLEVVNSMLDTSAFGNGAINVKPVAFLPDEIAMLSVNMLAVQANAKKIGLEYTPQCAFDLFEGDRTICRQILVNLLTNAVKFTETGGRVSLNIDMVGDGLLIEVADTGIGMSTGELARAGTPYFRVVRPDERAAQGTGLGLALVRKMANAHRGSMEIESTPGEGTRVRVVLARLPIAEHANLDIPVLRPPKGDESARIILLSEEQYDEAPRKTA